MRSVTSGFYSGVMQTFQFDNGATSPSWDWIFVRKFVFSEPTITLSGGGNATPISADFSGTPTTSAVYAMPVQFTDASIGTPTTWNWTFGDTYTSTLQNPLHFYDVAGQYDVSLNVTNSTGSYSLLTKTAYITLSSDLDSNLKSWMHYNTSATFDSIGNAWTALGGAALTAAPFKMGGTGSLDLTTNNARITSASATTWNLGSNDFTIEFWIYPNTPGAAGNIISRTTATGSGTGSGWGFYNNGAASGYGFWMGSVANLTPTFSLTNGVWQHVAIQRTSGTVTYLC